MQPNSAATLKRWCRIHSGPLSLALFYGVLISALPHLLWWSKNGGPFWIGSQDELVSYFPLASQAYFNHPLTLSDPAFPAGGLSMFPWLLFVPAIAAAKLLHLGPLGVGLMWRIWAGASVAFGFYLAVHHFVRKPWWAALAAILLMSDAGVMWGRLLLNHALMAAHVLRAHIPDEFFQQNSMLLLHWRIITPALSWFFLFVHLALLYRAKDLPDKRRLLLSGFGYGLLFHAYFYYWTAASAALALAWFLDPSNRRVYFHTAWIGGVIGLPEVLKGTVIKHKFGEEWLYRTDKFVAIPHFSEIHFSKVGVLLLVLSLVWILRRRRDLLYLWLLAAAATLLENHQILTGLQIENFHWEYVSGVCLSLLVVIFVTGLLQQQLPKFPRLTLVLMPLLILHALLGLWFRALEATRPGPVLQIQSNYRHYREQRAAQPQTQPFASNSIVAGDDAFVDFASIVENQRPLERTAFLSPTINTQEWDERVTLNCILRGMERNQFIREQEQSLSDPAPGPWKRNPTLKAVRVARRTNVYDHMKLNPALAADQFHVRYVGLPAKQSPPAYLRVGWKRVEAGPYWQIWERQLSSAR